MTVATMNVPPPRRRSRAACPWGLLGMVALVALIEAGLDRHRDRWSSPTASGFEWAHRGATARSAPADVVVLGDSVLKFGLAPRVFERGTGRTAANWATVGNPPAVALSLLRAHLCAGGRPRAIVVDFKPFLLDQGAEPELDAWARIATWGDALELARATGDADFLARFALARVLPSTRDRRGIRGHLSAALAGRIAPDDPAGRARLRNWWVNGGAQLLAPVAGAADVAGYPNEAPNLRGDWTCRPANAALIARFFAEAARHSIPVVWVLTPIHPRLQAGRDARGIDAAFSRFVRRQADQAPGRVTVVDARRLGLGAERFVDGTHLDARGAVAFTAALAAWFAGRDVDRPAEPWVDLRPAAADLIAAAEGDVEDLAGSTRAITRAEAAKRLAMARPAGVK